MSPTNCPWGDLLYKNPHWKRSIMVTRKYWQGILSIDRILIKRKIINRDRFWDTFPTCEVLWCPVHDWNELKSSGVNSSYTNYTSFPPFLQRQQWSQAYFTCYIGFRLHGGNVGMITHSDDVTCTDAVEVYNVSTNAMCQSLCINDANCTNAVTSYFYHSF